MQLIPERSICEPDQKIIVSKDKGTPRKHRANNPGRNKVRHYKLDGDLVRQKTCCDYLLLNDSARDAYFIELKGGNTDEAVRQLRAGLEQFRSELTGYQYYFRIVASKVRTHNISKTEFRKFQDQYGSRLKLKTDYMEETL